MRQSLMLQMVAGLAIGVLASTACLGTIGFDPGGAPPATGAGGDGGGEGGAGGVHCSAPADTVCDEIEDCECDACKTAAFCAGGRGCISDGFCGLSSAGQGDGGGRLGEDTCLCADCDHDLRCVSHCDHDALCDPEHEGCGCEDCFGEPECADNAAFCQTAGTGGGIVSQEDVDVVAARSCSEGESCDCIDCLRAERCLCTPNGWCEAWEPCTCADCAASARCVGNCQENDVCAGNKESCICSDCRGEPLCAFATTGACENMLADGLCPATESCACVDCMAEERCLCTAAACYLDTPCTCSICDIEFGCLSQCNADNHCDVVREGCACVDCASEPSCQDNLTTACEGGAPDGSCNFLVEPGCVDCMGTQEALCGVPDDVCGPQPCYCVDCANEAKCAVCFIDDFCDPSSEGCSCADCANLKVCIGT